MTASGSPSECSDRARHQHVAGGSRRREHLARGDPVSAFDLLGLARAADPVGAAAGQEDDAVLGDALQQRLDGRHLLVAPAPCRNGDLVGVHGKRQRGRAAGMGEDAQHVGELGDFRAAAAEFARHAGLDQARRLSAPRSSPRRSGRPRPRPQPGWRTPRRACGQSPRCPRRTSLVSTFGTVERSVWFVMVCPPSTELTMVQGSLRRRQSFQFWNCTGSESRGIGPASRADAAISLALRGFADVLC